MHFTPLIFKNFDYAWSFSAELSPEGLIGIAGSTLRWVVSHVRDSFAKMRKRGRNYPYLGHAEDLDIIVPIVPTEILTDMLYKKFHIDFWHILFQHLPDPQTWNKTQAGRDPALLYTSQVHLPPHKPVFLLDRRWSSGIGRGRCCEEIGWFGAFTTAGIPLALTNFCLLAQGRKTYWRRSC